MEEKLREEIKALIQELTNQDSISIGGAKTGEVKIYFNASKPEEAEAKLIKVIEILQRNRGKVLGGE